MENSDLELGSGDHVDMIQLRLDYHVENEARHRNQSSPSIFMVPSRLRDVSPNSFNPRVVSIGPLHKDDVNVQAFEGQKSCYLIYLMNRIKNSSKEEVWKTCMQKAYTLMNKIKACYVWPETMSYSDAEIAEMMVIDACFILEFTYQPVYDKESLYLKDELQYKSVMDDLVLLENQIPLFFLNEIYHCTILKFDSHASLIKLIHELLHGKISNFIFSTTLEININDNSISSANHILSLLHQCYMPRDDMKEVRLGSRIHSAIDLDMAGVKLKPSNETENPTWVMGIEMKQNRFPYRPTLVMPKLKVRDSTEFLLRNLIAYEQSLKTKMYFTSYSNAMNMLVNTQEDVAKLVDSEVLVNLMGSNEEAANMINNLGKNVRAHTFYEEEWKKLNKYCKGYWPKHIARVRSTYFQSRWSVIALLAGIILFVLQVVQTIFTILSSGRNM
ncbi:hypothetical protein SSX86_022326 [Deinandra increscens subsp. villosa]|uniref:Uncharacterized protein n=1 Tax=Deinandra increscens subsp. villosa TaxID=3103831 RepID=A0AAP0CIV0_9ASTR